MTAIGNIPVELVNAEICSEASALALVAMDDTVLGQ